MKKLAFWSLCLSLGMFVAGCSDTTTKKDKTTMERKVETNQDTGEQKVSEETETTSTDDETGAETKTKTEEEETTKPAQDEDGNAADNATETTETTDDDNK